MADDQVKDTTKTKTDKIKAIKELTDGLYRKILGMVVIVGGGFFLWEAAFGAGADQKKEVIGFIMGVGITTVFNFFFGTSQGSADKAKQISKVLNGKEEE